MKIVFIFYLFTASLLYAAMMDFYKNPTQQCLDKIISNRPSKVANNLFYSFLASVVKKHGLKINNPEYDKKTKEMLAIYKDVILDQLKTGTLDTNNELLKIGFAATGDAKYSQKTSIDTEVSVKTSSANATLKSTPWELDENPQKNQGVSDHGHTKPSILDFINKFPPDARGVF